MAKITPFILKFGLPMNLDLKIHIYPSLLPQSIRETILADSPVAGSNLECCENWRKIYNNPYHAKPIFFKGPLFLSGTNITELIPLTRLVIRQ